MRLLTALALSALLGGSAAGRCDTESPAPPTDMVLVPAGQFIMGTNQGDPSGPNKPRYYADAQPEHNVNVAAFYIDKTEVTNQAYKDYCVATGYPVPPHWKNNTFPTGQAEVPVTRVNWWEAGAYAAWAGKRLPTEAEWEKAARGPERRAYPWGEKWEGDRAVFNVASPQKVGTKPEGASPYGALDMAGNVYEWVNDWYQGYPGVPKQLPEFGKQYKVTRGGGFGGFEFICYTYYRSVARPASRSEWIGFRCAKDVP